MVVGRSDCLALVGGEPPWYDTRGSAMAGRGSFIPVAKGGLLRKNRTRLFSIEAEKMLNTLQLLWNCCQPMNKTGYLAILLTIFLTNGTLFTAQTTRYFKAEHGVGATYLQLGGDGQYRVIDCEHMGIFLTDEGRWQQTEAVIKFVPKDGKQPSYQAIENRHNEKTYLAITDRHAAAGIVIPAEEINKELDADPRHLPNHVLFEITEKVYNKETKQTYPFQYIGKEHSQK
jgi:hypothetical protein